MKPAPEICVIIPHYNGEAILRDCLDSLYRTTAMPLEVLLVDNASTDNSAAMVKSEFPQTRILSLEKNLGFAGGCNAGIRAAQTPYVLILNNDTIHQQGWIEELYHKIRSAEDIAAVQPKLLSYQNQDQFDYSGACGGEMDLFGFPYTRGRIFEYIEADHKQYDALEDTIFWASGTAFLARRELLLEAGLFDEEFFAHMEEIDLQWRLQLMGYRIVIEPQSVIWHRSGYTLSAESPLKKYLNHRNSLFMFLANYRLFLTLYLLPVRILLDWMALSFSLYRLDFGRAWAVAKAHLWILRYFPKVLRKRRQVKSIRRMRDRHILARLYHGSIALAAFLLKRRKFSDL